MNPGTRRGWVVNAKPQPLYPWERNPVPVVHKAGWALEMIWIGLESLTPNRGSNTRP